MTSEAGELVSPACRPRNLASVNQNNVLPSSQKMPIAVQAADAAN